MALGVFLTNPCLSCVYVWGGGGMEKRKSEKEEAKSEKQTQKALGQSSRSF